jgi:hypothetical protein
MTSSLGGKNHAPNRALKLALWHQYPLGFDFRCAFRLRGYWTTGRPPSASFFSAFTRASLVRCSQVPGRSFGTRRLLSPRRVRLGVFSIIRPERYWFHPLWGPDHSRFSLSRPISSSLALRLAPLPSEASSPRSRGDPLGRLHVFDALYMANSFHLARTPRLLLAHHKRESCDGESPSLLPRRPVKNWINSS